MSEDYGLACTNCREYTWIAQDGIAGFIFYYGEEDTMLTLRWFLDRHRGAEHPLVFDMTQILWCDSFNPPDGYAEVLAEPDGTIQRRRDVEGQEVSEIVGRWKPSNLEPQEENALLSGS